MFCQNPKVNPYIEVNVSEAQLDREDKFSCSCSDFRRCSIINLEVILEGKYAL